MPDKDKILIKDKRTIDAVTGKPLTDKNRLHTTVAKETVKQIILGAKKRGLDPNIALAIAMQETNFGDSKAKIYYGDKDDQKTNIFQVDEIQKKANPNEDKEDWEIGLDIIKEKLKLGKKLGKKDEASIIQAYNGYGKIGGKVDTNALNKYLDKHKADNSKKTEDEYESFYKDAESKFKTLPNILYGIYATQEKPIDMNTNPIYGKRIINIRDSILKTNPDIQKMVRDIYGGEPIHATKEHIEEAKQKLGFSSDDNFHDWMMKIKGKKIIPIDDYLTQ